MSDNQTKTEDRFKHRCPVCGSKLIKLSSPKFLVAKIVTPKKLKGAGDSYRMSCDDCGHSTSNHVSIKGVLNEWKTKLSG